MCVTWTESSLPTLHEHREAMLLLTLCRYVKVSHSHPQSQALFTVQYASTHESRFVIFMLVLEQTAWITVPEFPGSKRPAEQRALIVR